MRNKKIEIHYKRITARSELEASRKLRRNYPRMKIISYKFKEDYRFVNEENKDYKNRKMNIWFIKDMYEVWK